MHIAVAAYLGLGKKPETKGSQAKTPTNTNTGEDPAQLLAQFPGGMIH